MRLMSAALLACLLATAFAVSGLADGNQQGTDVSDAARSNNAERGDRHRDRLRRIGKNIFRFDTFGDEQLWTDVLRMHEVLPSVDPTTALAVGLKVDVDALPRSVIKALRAKQLDLHDPAVTVELLRLNAVVGLRGSVNDQGQLTSVGTTCALCHSSVDNSFAPSIGHRLDGWANTDLNVGAIAALSPALDDATKAEFRTWGPGKYDPRHHAFDGANIIPLNSPSVPVVIPSIFGLQGVSRFATYTADGSISYWNSYVGVGQMGGHGRFNDPRIGLFINQTSDRVTPKLPALLEYQLSLRTPAPPLAKIDLPAAVRGRRVFRNEGRCSACHQGPTFTDVLNGPDRRTPLLHDPAEVGTDPRYAERSATGQYRTTPLRGLIHHVAYFHDGSATTLAGVVDHYDKQFNLHLTARQKADLVAYLKTL